MLKTVLNSKIHRAKVTECDLDYVGSITIDRDLMDAVGLVANEQVHVLDINNGNRLTTYVIEGKRGSGDIAINGPAARLVSKGDLVIICAYVQVNELELLEHKPQILLVDEFNRPKRILDREEAFTRI
jgi:aspartate 1-decarboxylase